MTESFDAVLAEWLNFGGDEYDMFADRLQSAHARELAEQGEAVELTKCCGREECGGECGNEWRGMEWVRKAQPEARGVEGMVGVAVAHSNRNGEWLEVDGLTAEDLSALDGHRVTVAIATPSASDM